MYLCSSVPCGAGWNRELDTEEQYHTNVERFRGDMLDMTLAHYMDEKSMMHRPRYGNIASERWRSGRK